jgi:hypothetical protein
VSDYRYFRLSIMRNSSDSAPNVRILSAQLSVRNIDRSSYAFEYTVHCIDIGSRFGSPTVAVVVMNHYLSADLDKVDKGCESIRQENIVQALGLP